MNELSENQLDQRAEQRAKGFLQKYEKYMEALEGSPLSRVRKISSNDIMALGEQLEQFSAYSSYVKESGTAADLGRLPTIAFDIITASYGSSILPIIASIQPIEEVRGTIYFKQAKAQNTRGNVTAGQLTQNPLAAPGVYPRGYAGEKITTSLGTTAGADLDYAGTLASAGVPVRPNSVKVTVATTAGLTFTDDGNNNLLGVGGYGTIDYTTGEWTLTLNADPTAGKAIAIQYGTDFEAGGTYAKTTMITGSDSIEAEIFALGTEVGMFKAFSMKKRFGILAEEEMIADLTNEITAEVGNEALYRLTTAAVGNVDWSKTHTNYSWFEHKQELKDKLTEAEGNILTNAGRGVVNCMVAGAGACSILANLPGFTKANISAAGPQVYGTLDGTTVIRWPAGASDTIWPIYKGNGMFDAPMVYSPYMPLFVSGTLPVPNNALQKQAVAAVWAGMKVVVAPFCTKLTITA